MDVKPKRHKDRGFTLVEILIAIAMMSIIVIAIYGSLFSVLDSQKDIEGVLERTFTVKRFFDIFSIEMQSAFLKSNNPYTRFTGGKKGKSGRVFSDISFTTFVSSMHGEPYPQGDLMAIRYFLEDGEQGKMGLYKEVWNPYINEKGFKIEVIPEVEGFEVKYLIGRDWVSAWDGLLEKRPPDAVKASIFIKETGEVKEYSIILRTMIKG